MKFFVFSIVALGLVAGVGDLRAEEACSVREAQVIGRVSAAEPVAPGECRVRVQVGSAAQHIFCPIENVELLREFQTTLSLPSGAGVSCADTVGRPVSGVLVVREEAGAAHIALDGGL